MKHLEQHDGHVLAYNIASGRITYFRTATRLYCYQYGGLLAIIPLGCLPRRIRIGK